MTKYKVRQRPIGGDVELDQMYGVGAVFEADSSDDLKALVDQGLIEETDEEVTHAGESEEQQQQQQEGQSEPKSKQQPKAGGGASRR